MKTKGRKRKSIEIIKQTTKFHGNQCKLMEINSNQKTSKKTYGNLRKSIKIFEVIEKQ